MRNAEVIGGHDGAAQKILQPHGAERWRWIQKSRRYRPLSRAHFYARLQARVE
jgi:hypothetical protein